MVNSVSLYLYHSFNVRTNDLDVSFMWIHCLECMYQLCSLSDCDITI